MKAIEWNQLSGDGTGCPGCPGWNTPGGAGGGTTIPGRGVPTADPPGYTTSGPVPGDPFAGIPPVTPRWSTPNGGGCCRGIAPGVADAPPCCGLPGCGS